MCQNALWIRCVAPLYALFALAVARVESAETFGNFHTLGVVLDAPDGVAPSTIAQVKLYMVEANKKERRLLDPVQVHDYPYYAGSVFDLKPGSDYLFRAEFLNSSGKAIHSERFLGRTRPEPREPPRARREIHVSKNGADTNPGTSNRPKKTLAAAMRIANQPGTHVIVHAGVYHEGGLPALGKGTAQAPVVVRGAKGESAIIDGSDEPILRAVWKNLGDGFFSTPCDEKVWLVCIRNHSTGDVRRLYPVGSLHNLRARQAGKSKFADYQIREAYHCAPTEIVIYCPYYQPDRMTIHVARRKSFVEHSRSNHVIYSDLTVRFFQGQAIYVNNSNDITIRRCKFEFCTLPIAVKRESHRLLVEHCKFKDDCARWGFLPKGMDDIDYSAHIELGAVYVHNPYEGRGLVFRNNVIDGLFDGIHLTPMGPPPSVRTHETDFYNNHVVKVCDDVIEADGQCRNVRIFQNRMENFLSGVSIAQGVHGPTYVLRNILNGVGNSTAVRLPPHYEGYPIKTNGGTGHGETGWAFFYHNTSYTATPRTNAFRVQVAKWRKLIMANNIWQGTRDGFVFWRDDVSPISMSNDIIHARSGSLLKIRKRTFDNKSEAGRRLPFLRGAIAADPKLRDPAKGDFRLAAGSPAIDAGVLIPGVNDQTRRGAAPDIGALEFTDQR